jgi:uncharacterized protein YdeI (YjbR/CyaY-like superfamily)
MAKSEPNPKVDVYLTQARKWRKEIEKLRKIVLGCGLTEELKWRIPCYTFEGKNVVAINGLKDHCALQFFKGSLLKDAKELLLRPGENSQSTRWLKFASVQEIAAIEPILKAYLDEAIEVEKAGLKVPLKKITERPIPEELQSKFNASPALQTAFRALTPGRQRAYLIHFSQPKQSVTRVSRIEKCTPQILKGKGLNDR